MTYMADCKSASSSVRKRGSFFRHAGFVLAVAGVLLFAGDAQASAEYYGIGKSAKVWFVVAAVGWMLFALSTTAAVFMSFFGRGWPAALGFMGLLILWTLASLFWFVGISSTVISYSSDPEVLLSIGQKSQIVAHVAASIAIAAFATQYMVIALRNAVHATVNASFVRLLPKVFGKGAIVLATGIAAAHGLDSYLKHLAKDALVRTLAAKENGTAVPPDVDANFDYLSSDLQEPGALAALLRLGHVVGESAWEQAGLVLYFDVKVKSDSRILCETTYIRRWRITCGTL